MATEFSRETVIKIAELSRLQLTEEELTQYEHELAKILQAFQDLSKISLPAEMSGDARSALSLHKASHENEDFSRLRKDEFDNSILTQDFLSQAPEREGVFVRVPAILAPST